MRAEKLANLESATFPSLLICTTSVCSLPLYGRCCFVDFTLVLLLITSSRLSWRDGGQEGGGSFASLWVCNTRRQWWVLETPSVRWLSGCKSTQSELHDFTMFSSLFALCALINPDYPESDTCRHRPNSSKPKKILILTICSYIPQLGHRLTLWIIQPHPCVTFCNCPPINQPLM